MGSGKAAGNESKTAIEMLEELSIAGFETETALDMINSMLILKSGDEAFATLDICCVDLYTGIAEFIKTGAASTFLVRGEKAKSISSSALPIGMLKDVYAQKSRLMLKPNDIILMMTDGVADIIEKDMNAEKWLALKLGELKGAKPKETAEYILEKAREKANGVIKDDMTVIAAKIWEKAG
ncbi:Stage II sporulation protein E [bioreactor metagenome]|uniref:Stage II sporulation protein E n=1 Tax=bioreactor metagenome TaxID=1076179 RepID=A0A645B2Q9_9ZZZZ